MGGFSTAESLKLGLPGEDSALTFKAAALVLPGSLPFDQFSHFFLGGLHNIINVLKNLCLPLYQPNYSFFFFFFFFSVQP